MAGYQEMTKEFASPSGRYRSKPFWAWNGRLEEKELYRQLDVLKEMGFGGAFIHSRVGLETEYLGKEWMELVEKCLEYGKQIGLELWLYDEDRWPSGTAGGMVTKKPENRSKRLQLHVMEPEQAEAFLAENKNKVAAAHLCRLRGHEYENLRPYSAQDAAVTAVREKQAGAEPVKNEQAAQHCTERRDERQAAQPRAERQEEMQAAQSGADAQAADKALIITIEESTLSDNYNGYTYLDTMKRAAVDDYLASTHDRYHRELPVQALDGMPGMFTDEPHRGAYLCDFSEGNRRSVPYTEELFDAFEKKYGCRLQERLPEIFFRKKGNPYSRTAQQFLELTQEFFLQNFLGNIRERCEKYDWKSTGHLLQEDSLSSQVCMIGSVMAGYAQMDLPGIDMLGYGNDCWWIGKQLSSVAHQLDKKRMLTELFGCTGWQMELEQYKEIGDWQAMMGIDLFCPHLSWYTMQGENKRDYPASIFYQSAWYRSWKYVEDYFARIHVMTQGKPAQCSLLVLNPIESVWARAYSGAFQWIISADEGISAIEKQYEETFRILMEAGIDFDYGEEKILAEHGAVEDGRLRVGGAYYDKVLLSGAETVRESTWALLAEFAAQGGEIVIAGRAPERIGAVQDMRMDALAKEAARVPFTAQALRESCRPQKTVFGLDGHGAPVYMQVYRNDIGVSAVLLNMSRDTAASEVTLTVHGEGALELWDARTGKIHTVQADGNEETAGGVQTPKSAGAVDTAAAGQKADRTRTLRLSFGPGEEKIIVLREQNGKAAAETAAGQNETRQEAVTQAGDAQEADRARSEDGQGAGLSQTDFAYTLSEENVAVLERADVLLGGEMVARSEYVLKADRKLRTKLGFPWRGGEMMQPWYRERYVPESLCERHEAEVVYSFYIEEKALLAVREAERAGTMGSAAAAQRAMPVSGQDSTAAQYAVGRENAAAQTAAGRRGSAVLTLALEKRDVRRILVNGQVLADAVQLAQETSFWIDTAFTRVRIAPALLRAGYNELRLVYDYGRDSGLEAVYLLGTFGVALRGKDGAAAAGKRPVAVDAEAAVLPEMAGQDAETARETSTQNASIQEIWLTTLPERLRAGDVVPQGLPFYSGSITYHLDETMRGEHTVRFPQMTAALAVVHGKSDETVVFLPYEAKVSGIESIEMVFHRRNTFGPFHVPLAYRGSYGPETFLTEGEEWAEELQLYPQGLPEDMVFGV